MDLSLQDLQHGELAVALVLVITLGCLVTPLINCLTSKLRPPKPHEFSEDEWNIIVGAARGSGGIGLGFFERILYVVGIFAGAYVVLAAWIAFKLGSKWETWSNIVKVGDYLGSDSGKQGFITRRQLGGWLLTRHLYGVLLNLLMAILCVVAASWLVRPT